MVDSGRAFSSIMDSFVRGHSGASDDYQFSIDDYKSFLLENCGPCKVSSIGVELSNSRYDRFLIPLYALGFKKSRMKWWQAFNAVKHSDIERRAEGNLENTLYAIAALFILFIFADKDAGIGYLYELFTNIKPNFDFDREITMTQLFFGHYDILSPKTKFGTSTK
ncbi:MAG: hypothetical protein M1368_02185 [Thaumarchaeota archaeon]|nr:hypothetical protein [Nitrososphaerota archaeon]